MDFKGKKFQYVEFVRGFEGDRGKFCTLSEAESFIWNNLHTKEEIWRTIYSYCDVDNLEYSYAPFYFESDIEDFELNRKVTLTLVDYLNNFYNIDINAFRFKLTNKSIWVEIVPTAFGVRPTFKLNEIYKRMIEKLTPIVENICNVISPFDTKVYNKRQLTRLVGSYLPNQKRYVIDVSYISLKNKSKSEIMKMSKKRYKDTYEANQEFFVNTKAKEFFDSCKAEVYAEIRSNKKGIKNRTGIRPCIENMQKIGVEEGNRNIALFYASINMRDSGIEKSKWLNSIGSFTENFDKRNIDNIKKIKATINSAYKTKYNFSCKFMKENMPDLCSCENCLFTKKNEYKNTFIIYKNNLKTLLEHKATPSTIRSYLILANTFDKKQIPARDISKLKKIGLINNEEVLCQKGPYIEIPKDFILEIDDIGAELQLFISILVSSNNNININPRKKALSYANTLNKSERSIKRMFNSLISKGFIRNSIISFKSKDKVRIINKDDLYKNETYVISLNNKNLNKAQFI